MSYPPGDDQPQRRPAARPAPRVVGGKGREPGWANGLRELYNSVLHEPLPGSFDDLLKQFDKDGGGKDASGKDGGS